MKIVKILGGLGNQMFQYAFYLSLCRRYKVVKVETGDFDTYDLHNGLELEKIFNIKLDRVAPFMAKLYDSNNRTWAFRKLRRMMNLKHAYYQEPSLFKLDYNVFIDSRPMIYWGYWQNENYFKDIANVIREKFSFKEPIDKKNTETYSLIANCNSVSIHIRRGDYIGHELLGGICDLAYYQKAIDLIHNRIDHPHFFIFSNDIDWCQENLKVSHSTFISWNSGKESYKDMQLMALCKHNIIANSSFSWWGAWLNENPDKIVITPKVWTNNPIDKDSFSVPQNWIAL